MNLKNEASKSGIDGFIIDDNNIRIIARNESAFNTNLIETLYKVSKALTASPTLLPIAIPERSGIEKIYIGILILAFIPLAIILVIAIFHLS